MFFNEEFIAKVEEEPISGIVSICAQSLAKLEELDNGAEWTETEHEILWETAAFLDTVIQANGFELEANLPEASGEMHTNCASLKNYVDFVNNHFTKLKTEQITLLNVKGSSKN